MWSPLPKTQRRVKTLRHSPCDDIRNAAMTQKLPQILSDFKRSVSIIHLQYAGISILGGCSHRI
jgi:hypothetical protein